MALVFAVGAWHAVGAVWDSTVGLGLPYRAPEELVALNGGESENPFGRFLSDREAALLRERADSFAWVGHLWGPSMTLGDPATRSLWVGGLEPGFLEVLRGVPAAGKAVSFPKITRGRLRTLRSHRGRSIGARRSSS